MEELKWGDTVRIKQYAETKMRPGSLAEVVGIREVETPEQEIEFSIPLGAKIYLLEYGDGFSMEVTENWIEQP